VAAAALSAVVVAAPAPGRAQLVTTVGRLFVTGDVGGRLADPLCQRTDRLLEPAPFARVATHLAIAAGQSDSPFVLDAGNLLSPHGVTRFAAAEDPEGLAALVAALGYRALALGTRDLAAPRAPLLATLSALRAQGVPMLASNLRCREEGAPLCEALVDGDDGVSLHRLGRQRIAVLSILPPEVTRAVPRANLRGLELLDPVQTLARGVRLAREIGEDVLVAATVDLAGEDDPSSRALALVGGLDAEERPDLLVVAGAGRELLFARPASFQPALVAPAPGGSLEVRVRDNLYAESYDLLALPLEERRFAALPVLRWIDALGPSYCRELGQPLPGGRLDAPLDALGLLELAGRVAREELGGEVAVLPRRILERSWSRGETDVLTAGDVRVGLRYDSPLVRVDVPASWLAALQKKGDDRLLVIGAEGTGSTLRVNGRPLETRGRYPVVTTQFLAEGGLAALPEGVDWRDTGESLQELLHRWLAAPRPPGPRAAVADPAQGVDWEVGATVDATFDGTSVGNPDETYQASLLTGQDNISFGGRLRLEADAVHPDWSFENDLDLRYTINLLENERSNPTDLVQLRTSFFYRALRSEDSPAYVPALFLENLFESEFTTPAADDRADTRDEDEDDPSLRDYYRLFTRPVAGARFPLDPKLDLKLGFSVELERIQATTQEDGMAVPATDARGDPVLEVDARPGFNAQLRLDPLVLLEDGPRILRTSFRFDANLSNWFEPTSRSTQLRATTDFVFQIKEPFALTLTYDLFAQRDGGADFGVYLRGTIALTVFALARGVLW